MGGRREGKSKPQRKTTTTKPKTRATAKKAAPRSRPRTKTEVIAKKRRPRPAVAKAPALLDVHALLLAARSDAAARSALLEAARAEPRNDELVDALGTVEDDEVFGFVREMALKQLDLEYFDTRPRWLFALGELGQFPRFADGARAALLGGFDRLVSKSRKKESVLVNAVAFGALAHAVAELAHPQTGPALLKAFEVAAGQTDLDAHHELNVTCGPLAIALAAVDHVAALPALDAFLAQFEARHRGETFVMEVLYGKWLLARDGAAALAYLATPHADKGLAFAAAALADLHHVGAYEALAARAATLRNPVATEAFAEAMARLARQTAPPPVRGRMIWMFGRRSPTEQALGEDSDNIFAQRAATA